MQYLLIHIQYTYWVRSYQTIMRQKIDDPCRKSPVVNKSPKKGRKNSYPIHFIKYSSFYAFIINKIGMSMEEIDLIGLQNFFKELQSVANFNKRYAEINEGSKIGVEFVSRKRIIEWAKNINKREEKHYIRQMQQTGSITVNNSWAFGEWKIFAWVVVSTAVLYERDISSLSDQQIQEIGLLFRLKSFDFIKFQFLSLIKSSTEASRHWEDEEIKILVKILEAYREKEYNWREITFELFCRSGHRFYRGVNKCKEKWLNHLNPNLMKEGWSLEQDLRLIKLVRKEGTKWAFISQRMNHTRTEHMVKNRYFWYLKNMKEHKDDDEMDVLERIYVYLKQTNKNMELRRQAAAEMQAQPMINQNMEVQPMINENRVKLESIQKENEVFPSTRSLVKQEPVPSTVVYQQPEPLIKCQQVEPEPMQNSYYPFLPMYYYMPVPELTNFGQEQ